MLRIQLIAMAILLAFAGCKKGSDGESKVPPATGPGAAKRKPLPPLGKASDTDDGTIARTSETTTGTTYPTQRVAISPKMTGTLAEIKVDEGSIVKKNDVLFRLRTDDISLRVNQARAALAAARVRKNAVKVEYDRTKSLLAKNAVNQMAWDKVNAEYAAAQVGVRQAKAALSLAQHGWADAVGRSPINGVVVKKLKEAGELVTLVPPTVVLIIEDQSKLELRFRLSEGALRELKVGQKFIANFDSVGVKRTATVIRIGARVDQRTRTIEVVSSIDNPGGLLKPGMLATVRREGVDAKKDEPAPKKGEPAPKKAKQPLKAAKPKAGGTK